MLGLIAGVALGAAGALAYANRASLVKDVQTEFHDAVDDLDALEAKFTGIATKTKATADAHAVLAAQSANLSASAAALAKALPPKT